MKLRKGIALILLLAIYCVSNAQEIPLEYTFGEKYNDRYKYSNLLTIGDNESGGTLLVRAYYTGMVLRPKGYFIENYDKDLNLVSEFNYKLKNSNFVEGYVRNGQIYLLFLDYNIGTESYDYVVHRSPMDEFNFTEETILSIKSDPVREPLGRNYYNRKFTSGFTSSVLFNDEKSAFVISTHFKKGKIDQHLIHLYNASLDKLMTYDFSETAEEKNYSFENVVFSQDLDEVYIVGKAYFKKRRFTAKERKFQYEMIQITRNGALTQSFDDFSRFSEGLKPIMKNGKLFCVGFYADRKDDRYNGLSYFEMNPLTLELKTKKYNPFSDQFMNDKFGREGDKEIKNLVFKNLSITNDGSILFNAEEFFVTNSVQSNSSGGRVKVERFHHNDIVSAKLNASGDIVWVRNINKAEVTQGDGAYASYSSYVKEGKTYFFIATSAENPQLMSGERLLFKQGLSRNRNIFTIQLDENGKISFEKLIDDKEARLPLMVNIPLINTDKDQLLFYAKRGTKKQLVKVGFKPSAIGASK
ncbi:hypothetical protein JQC67_04385 [Aurantibacter crassamenti]|uniref:hypothetical protein n=1 Tax=Aurantibacter crassamenti TaxID=1837375 RepID=UPI0019399C53|nr:hypothetical protein [Aurantibacter crassamenti]MBM1105373.1 hypothetical protein [Aurantibacter crassamenti]